MSTSTLKKRDVVMSHSAVKVGRRAPNVTVQDELDEPVALSHLWSEAERGIVLSFLRHYG